MTKSKSFLPPAPPPGNGAAGTPVTTASQEWISQGNGTVATTLDSLLNHYWQQFKGSKNAWLVGPHAQGQDISERTVEVNELAIRFPEFRQQLGNILQPFTGIDNTKTHGYSIDAVTSAFTHVLENAAKGGYKSLSDYMESVGGLNYVNEFSTLLGQTGYGTTSTATAKALITPNAAQPPAAKGTGIVTTPSNPNAVLSNASQTKDYSSYEQVMTDLAKWGLDDPALAYYVQGEAMAGGDANQIIRNIRESSAYKTMYPANAERAKLGLPPIAESTYNSLENSFMGLANKYALPKGFISKAEVGQLIAQNVSPAEFNQRLTDLSNIATKADPLVKQEFEKYFGVKNSMGALTAYFADPKRATDLISQQASAAEFGAQAQNEGLGALDKSQALQLGQYEYQHTAGTVGTALDKAASEAYLGAGAPGSVAPRVSENQLIGQFVAGYSGTNQAGAQASVANAEHARESFLQGGGGFAADARGVRGAGSGSTEGTPNT